MARFELLLKLCYHGFGCLIPPAILVFEYSLFIIGFYFSAAVINTQKKYQKRSVLHCILLQILIAYATNFMSTLFITVIRLIEVPELLWIHLKMKVINHFYFITF